MAGLLLVHGCIITEILAGLKMFNSGISGLVARLLLA